MHCTTGLFELTDKFIPFMSRSRCGLKNSGVEQSKGHTGQGSLRESMLETVTRWWRAGAQQQQ